MALSCCCNCLVVCGVLLVILAGLQNIAQGPQAFGEELCSGCVVLQPPLLLLLQILQQRLDKSQLFGLEHFQNVRYQNNVRFQGGAAHSGLHGGQPGHMPGPHRTWVDKQAPLHQEKDNGKEIEEDPRG
jgi:hypothetical protein